MKRIYRCLAELDKQAGHKRATIQYTKADKKRKAQIRRVMKAAMKKAKEDYKAMMNKPMN